MKNIHPYFKIFAIFILAAWCLYGTIAPFFRPHAISDPFGFFVVFLTLVLPGQFLLFIISFFVGLEKKGNQKVLGWAGVFISIITLIVNLGVVIWNFAR
ncbi:hypothetical protein IT407_02150 [Candidatus Uhrbacteria bacterium]|nr:hypothetical protein [Candidatus Uhrbacteria bacterium]